MDVDIKDEAQIGVSMRAVQGNVREKGDGSETSARLLTLCNNCRHSGVKFRSQKFSRSLIIK